MRFALTLLLLSLAFRADAQPDPTSFQELLDGAREEASVLDGEQRDEFWQDFASEAFAFYRANPMSDGGREALGKAFQIWGNDGTLEDITGALAYIDPAADVWDASLLNRVAFAYARAGQHDNYIALLHDLRGKLTHPRGVSTILLQLSRKSLTAGRDEEVRPYLEQIVTIAADSASVAEAEGYLYQIDHLAIGMEAPDFSTPTIAGDTLRLSDLRGQVVLLDFWATHCAPCLPEIPYLVEANDTYADHGFAIVGISQDWSEDVLQAMIDEQAMTWLHVWEPVQVRGAPGGEVTERYNIRWIPQTFLLDREGRIVAKDLRGKALAEAVAKLL
jgi:peroxiredoxin